MSFRTNSEGRGTAGPDLQALRARVRSMEGGGLGRPARLPLGVPEIDAALPDRGLPLGCLHEIVAEGASLGAATGFALWLLSRLAARADGKPVLWCRRSTLAPPYAPGLRGVAPARVILVDARADKDGLWALEEGVRCHDLAASLAELSTLPMVAGRRLQLAAEAGGTTGLILRPPAVGDPSVASTRWRVSAWPSAAIPDPYETDPSAVPWIGATRWRLCLERCRGGIPGAWIVEHCDETDRLRLAALSDDRPAAAWDGRRAAG